MGKQIPWSIRLHNLSLSHNRDDKEATSQQLFSHAPDRVYPHSYICKNYSFINGIEDKESVHARDMGFSRLIETLKLVEIENFEPKYESHLNSIKVHKNRWTLQNSIKI